MMLDVSRRDLLKGFFAALAATAVPASGALANEELAPLGAVRPIENDVVHVLIDGDWRPIGQVTSFSVRAGYSPIFADLAFSKHPMIPNFHHDSLSVEMTAASAGCDTMRDVIASGETRQFMLSLGDGRVMNWAAVISSLDIYCGASGVRMLDVKLKVVGDVNLVVPA